MQPLFMTVDPQRDTPDVLQQYTPSFSARIIDLSGDPQQIAAAAQAYGPPTRQAKPAANRPGRRTGQGR
jgi:cytochrome oxidase Cu insertion factor (SCO1/SenC/PrrC family)